MNLFWAPGNDHIRFYSEIYLSFVAWVDLRIVRISNKNSQISYLSFHFGGHSILQDLIGEGGKISSIKLHNSL